MMQERIQREDITKGLPPTMQAYLAVESIPLPQQVMPMIKAFWEAAHLIEPAIRIRYRVSIVFAVSPFRLELPQGTLTYALPEGALCTFVENMIFVDCNRVNGYPYGYQVAIFLEELVHAYMNVADEELVKHIVVCLYEKMTYENGRYALK